MIAIKLSREFTEKFAVQPEISLTGHQLLLLLLFVGYNVIQSLLNDFSRALLETKIYTQ